MNTTSVSFSLNIIVFMILLVQWMRRPIPQIAGYRSQIMCANCGLITSRSKLCCRECGKPLSAV